MKRISKFICLVISVMVLLSFANITSIAADNFKVSGTLSLPDGMKAPAGGLTVELLVCRVVNEHLSMVLKFIDTTIPEGADSIDYSISFQDDNSGAYTVEYRIKDLKGLSLVETGDYKQYEHPNTAYYEGFRLSNGAKDHIDLKIYAARTIKGTISFPNGIKAAIPEGRNETSIPLEIQVYGAKSGTYISQQNVNIPSGENSAGFTVNVPAGAAEKQFILRYYNDSYSYAEEGHTHPSGDKPWMSGFLPYGYYKQEGATAFQNDATPVDGSGNISIVILPCKTIGGVITDPTVTDSSDMDKVYRTEVVVKAVEVGNLSHEFETTAYLSGNYGSYSIVIPQSDKKYYISYSLFSYGGKGPVALGGYYSNSGTVSYKENETSVQVGSGVKNTNLRLQVMRKISGKISLPKGMKAPSKGLVIEVGAMPDYMTNDPVVLTGHNYYMRAGAITNAGRWTFTIKGGESSVAYSILAPANALTSGYKIRYSINETNGLALNKLGYLSTKGVSSLIKDGSFIDVSGADKNDADFTILKKGEVSIVQAVAKPGSVTGYDRSVPIKMYSGSSSITVDNSKGQSGVSAKLYYVGGSKPEVVRTFSVKKGDKFTLVNLTAGDYVLHVRDVTNLEQYKTDKLTLTEKDGWPVDMTVTLYGVKDGNLHTQSISSSEF